MQSPTIGPTWQRREVTTAVTSSTDTDALLLEAARRGDIASYGRLVERYQGIAHRTAHVMGAGDDTSDVVQEAFVKAFRALPRFRSEQPFRPWLLAIVANEVRNRWRWTARHRAVSLELVGDVFASTQPTPEMVGEQRDASRRLAEAVSGLPRQQREAIVCRYLLDLSEQETSQVLGVPAGTVKSRLSRGLRSLQETYGKQVP